MRNDVQDATQKPKRKQVKNACVNCQKACKRCDEGRPCQRCIRLGLTSTCTNSPRKERKKGIKRGPYKKQQQQQQQQSRRDSQSTNDISEDGFSLHPSPTAYINPTPFEDLSWHPTAWTFDHATFHNQNSQMAMTDPLTGSMFSSGHQLVYTDAQPYMKQQPLPLNTMVLPQQPYPQPLSSDPQYFYNQQQAYYYPPEPTMEYFVKGQQPAPVGSWQAFLSTA